MDEYEYCEWIEHVRLTKHQRILEYGHDQSVRPQLLTQSLVQLLQLLLSEHRLLIRRGRRISHFVRARGNVIRILIIFWQLQLHIYVKCQHEISVPIGEYWGYIKRRWFCNYLLSTPLYIVWSRRCFIFFNKILDYFSGEVKLWQVILEYCLFFKLVKKSLSLPELVILVTGAVKQLYNINEIERTYNWRYTVVMLVWFANISPLTRCDDCKYGDLRERATWIPAGPQGMNCANFLSRILSKLLCTYQWHVEESEGIF